MEKLLSFAIQEQCGDMSAIQSLRSVGGGSINQCYEVRTDGGHYFVKCNRSHSYPLMFEKEVKGLDLLRSAAVFRVPRCYGVSHDQGTAMLVMEYIEPGTAIPASEEAFGRALASMHLCHGAAHGLDHDNYIGSLPQANETRMSWPKFFLEQRLQPMMERAMQANTLTRQDAARIDRLSSALTDLFPLESPSLLHGDLWAGNHMYDRAGQAVVFDPAVYYGHRYMDLGMMQLFGGYSDRVMDAYRESYPLPANWREGAEVANLYPLLVHTVLFGASYATQVRSTLERYT